ncbi:hypothetical protein [Nitratireductor indicus]|uniref:Uncharacterized protein n=1 Tax=Nitratireductor indicus C115 TaxID=1231190 RepID=K2P033_9HYPH|nr:hypothetical protein [Nitratireductor indicus]EKF40646.1 hypothetical protein NA8A_19895 [Nitratireductor indicus C115]MDS1134624.1 hypothetical protein [Nitratireductor indicus]SFQ43454.1 hypothetical protein SAMN05216176_103399 [Nitratireductor indicus]
MLRLLAHRTGQIALLAFSLAFSLPGNALADAAGKPLLLAQGGADCYSVGARVAAQQGGQLVQATAENRGGQTVCRVVIVIPGNNGQRPKRAEFVVPAN